MRGGVQEDHRARTYNQRAKGGADCLSSTLSANVVMQRLGFDSFTSEVEDVLKDHKAQQKVRPSGQGLRAMGTHSACRIATRRFRSSSNLD